MTHHAEAAQNIDEALARLQAAGSVMLAGKPATWSSGLRVLMIILLVLVVLVGLGSIGGIPFAIAAGLQVGPGTIFGVVGVGGMILLGIVLLRIGIRNQQRHRVTEREPIVIEQRGLTLRGVGPIPWSDFGHAEHRMVPAERDSGYVRRAVMELTPVGMANVNERLPRNLRERISPKMGPIWNQHHRYVYVPAAEGLSQREVMHLINAAREMFLAPPR